MPARTHPLLAVFAASYQAELVALDRGARKRFGFGVTPRMYRLAELVWNVLALAATVWFVGAGVEPVYALAFGALLIGGEKALQTYLVGVGIADQENFDAESD